MRLEISSSPVRAVIATWPEMSVPALVMNCLAPSITQLVVVERRARLDVAGVRAGLGLGQPERAELAPGAQVGQQSRLLLVGAEEVDRLRAERGVGAHRDRDRASRRASAPRRRSRTAACCRPPPPTSSGNGMPIQPELAHLCRPARTGSDFVRSSSSATGATSPTAKSRTVRWSSCVSSSRSNSMLVDYTERSFEIRMITSNSYIGEPLRHDPRCASATTAASDEVVLDAARVFAEQRLRPDVGAGADRGDGPRLRRPLPLLRRARSSC